MSDGKRIYLVDDDRFGLEVMSRILRQAGHEVGASSSSLTALQEIPAFRPDCVLVDLMMPDLDGFELCKRLRMGSASDVLKIIVVSGKSYEFDRRRAREVGADGYIVKPITAQTFADEIARIFASRIQVDYWGVRGTLPVSGPQTLRYGGCTSCVSLTFADDSVFIFDAGSGIRVLGNYLMGLKKRLTGKIFISHPHWDHINALPFFAPLYVQGNEFEILGPAHADMNMHELISAQMDGVYFPITIREFGASVHFRDLREERLAVNDITLRTMLLSHPGNCLGYRVEHGGKSICYITDNELFLPGTPQHNPEYVERLAAFVAGTDILIADTTYTDDGYRTKIGWGHSCVGQVVELAHRAAVKELHLFHHDPDDTDESIDAKLRMAEDGLRALSSTVQVLAPAEGYSRVI